MDKTEMATRLEFRKAALTALRKAYIAIAKGGVQQYGIGSRNLTKLDLPKIKEEISDLEKEVDELSALLNGGKRRKAVAVVPRDW